MATAMAAHGGFVSERLINYHVARVKGGCGLNIVEIAAVHPTSRGPRNLGIYDDEFVPGLSKLTDAIKTAGGKAALQLWHAGRQTYSAVTGLSIVAPSAIPCPVCQEMPKELSKNEIDELVEAYGDAALRAKKAGFDAIELHGAHGYLIAQFISAYSNARTDEYGGPLENRARFALEVIQNIRGKVGSEFPVICRLSAEERVENGLTIEDSKTVAKWLEEAGVDAINASIGVYETLHYTVPSVELPLAFNVENAAAIKSIVKIPVLAVDRINDPILAEKILDEGKADFIVMGRAQITDPEFCNKAQKGDFDAIVKCIGCNQGCVERLFLILASGGMEEESISCLRNPACGREREYELIPTTEPKKVLIAGGGPGGLEAAITLRRRGHQPILCEMASGLGGQFFLAGVAPRKGEFSRAALQMGEIATREGVDVRLQTEVTPEFIEELDPDAVIVATGAQPIIPNIPGVNKEHVVTGYEVLKGSKTVKDKVLIVGGNFVGIAVAELLADQGKQLIIVERLDDIAKDLGMLRSPFIMKNFQDKAVKIITQAECKEINDNSVVIEKSGSQKEIKSIDSVVIAVGAKPENSLKDYLETTGRQYYVIGDAVEHRKALDAIWEANEVARRI